MYIGLMHGQTGAHGQLGLFVFYGLEELQSASTMASEVALITS